MKTKEIEAKCQKVVDKYKELDTLFDRLNETLGATINSPLGDAVWFLFQDYVDEVEAKIKDTSSFLSWYIYDNCCGTRELQAAVNGELKTINSVKRLAKLIKEHDKA